MQTIAHYAAAIILTSALGAFVLCLLVIRYGFVQADDEPLPTRHRRFFVTRLGHAVGAVCFAITAGLAAVALTLGSRPALPFASDASAPGAAAVVDVAPLQAGQTRLAHDMRALDERIERAEAVLAELRTAARTSAPVASAPVDLAPLQTGQQRLTHDVRTLDERIERTEAALADLRAARASGTTASAPVDVAPVQAGQARLARDMRALDERVRRTEAALAQLRPAAQPAAGDHTSRPVRRPPPVAPRDIQAERGAPPQPTPQMEGEAVAIPGIPMDTAAAAPSAAMAPAEPRPGDRVRAVKRAMSDIGDEVGRKAATAARAVRDFFRDP